MRVVGCLLWVLRRQWPRVRPWRLMRLTFLWKKGKSEGFDSCDRPSNLAQIWSKSSILSACVTLKFDVWPRKIIGHLFYTTSSFVYHFNPSVNSNWSYTPETLNSGRNRQFFVPCDLEIWWMTLKNNRAPLLCYFKLCASFHTHWWIQIWVTVRKRSIRVKIDDFFSRVT